MGAEDSLLRMKRQLDDAKSKKDQVQGALDELYKQLKADFDVETLDGLEDLLDKLLDEKESLVSDIERKTRELEDKYEL